MDYIKVEWLHDDCDSPIIFYSELDEDNYEKRKIEIWKNGKIGFAGENINFDETILGDQPVPNIDYLNLEDEFKAEKISKLEFEKIWDDSLKKI